MTSRETRHRRRGASLVEYALAIALVLVVSLSAIGAVEDSSADRLDERAGGVGDPDGLLSATSSSSTSSSSSSSSSSIPTGATSTTLPPSEDMSLADAIGSSAQVDKNSWSATVTISVVDADGDPVEGVLITASWAGGSGNPSTSCTTGTNGQCFVTRTSISENQDTVTLTISQVERDGFAWNQGGTFPPEVVDKPTGCCV